MKTPTGWKSGVLTSAVAGVMGLMWLSNCAWVPTSEGTSKLRSGKSPLNGKITCTLEAKGPWYVGEKPPLSVKLWNHTDQTVPMVGCLDGSGVKWRYPYCYFKVIGPNGRKKTEGVLRCGFMNPLAVKDFRKITPGKSFDPMGRGYFCPMEICYYEYKRVGIYHFRFYYSSVGNNIQDWHGATKMDNKNIPKNSGIFGTVVMERKEPAPTIQDLFQKTPKIRIRSNELSIELRPAPEGRKVKGDNDSP